MCSRPTTRTSSASSSDIKPNILWMVARLSGRFRKRPAVTAAGTERSDRIGLALGTRVMRPDRRGGEIDRGAPCTAGLRAVRDARGQPPSEPPAQALVAKQLTEKPLRFGTDGAGTRTVAEGTHKAMPESGGAIRDGAAFSSARRGPELESAARMVLAALAYSPCSAGISADGVFRPSRPRGPRWHRGSTEAEPDHFGEGIEEWPAGRPRGEAAGLRGEVRHPQLFVRTSRPQGTATDKGARR